jgi:HD-GYP domain-containing protein (c-di-GMP phosphodiesterase class II)
MLGGVAGDEARGVRLAELVAALSLGIDLGFGQPMEHVLRQCRIAMCIAERLDLGDEVRASAYWTALLVNVGCHTDAHEQAKWFGDDIALKGDKYAYDLHGPRSMLAGVRRIGAGRAPLHRFLIGLEFAVSGHRDVDGMIAQHAALARALAEGLRLPGDVLDALGASYEQWDGKGWPGALRGDSVPMAARIAQLAEFAEVAHRTGGTAAVRELARARSGKQFDPALCALMRDCADDVLGDLDATSSWESVVAAEPALGHVLTGAELDSALVAIADFVNLKSPYLLGHARALADLAADAAAGFGLPAAGQRLVRRAALVSGFGRLGISNAIWDKPGPLGAGEWERVRLHPYLTERMLRQSPALAAYGAVAAQQRERLDGSGYPRGLSGAAITPPARLLAAADAYQAMAEPRPHRSARSPDDAARTLRAEAVAGRLDAAAVDAVLAAAGHRVPRRRDRPAGLTAREAEVLVLLARGLSNKEVARALVISPKTAGNHVEHIYAKIGASNRAGASLFAVRHGLLPEQQRWGEPPMERAAAPP